MYEEVIFIFSTDDLKMAYIITEKPRWKIGLFNKSSIMPSIESSCMVDCGYKNKHFLETHLIKNKWHRKSFCTMDLFNVFIKVTIVVSKTF